MTSFLDPGSLQCYYHVGRYCFKSRTEFGVWLVVIGCLILTAVIWSIVDWRKKRR